MAGIISYGGYVPFYRLSRKEIVRAWGSGMPKGEKAVASFDEDSITMAVAAAQNCIKGINKEDIEGLYFASTTFPYAEKQSAAIVAEALGLTAQVRTIDISNSLRGGSLALITALDAVKAGSISNALVICADTRMGYPKGANENTYGDGAAALLIGDTDVAVEIDAVSSVTADILETWRSFGEVFSRQSEGRFSREVGYTKIFPKAMIQLLKEHGLATTDIAKLAYNAPDAGQHRLVAKKAGFDLKTQVQDPLLANIGNTGSAMALMILISALEKAKAGEKLLLGSYGDGCDVLLLQVTENIAALKDNRGIDFYLNCKKSMDNYMKYLLWRELIQTEPAPRPPQPMVSPPSLERDRQWGMALRGFKCMECNFIQFPAQMVCTNCGAVDKREPYEFSSRIGKLTTFSHDNLAAAIDPPTTICAVDFEGGGRIMCDMTDRDLEEVKAGMDVEMTFRKIQVVTGIHNYYWKCVPHRG